MNGYLSFLNIQLHNLYYVNLYIETIPCIDIAYAIDYGVLLNYEIENLANIRHWFAGCLHAVQ